MIPVDVFIPCYNYGRFLREATLSVLTQVGVDVRVLILDDCSSDESEQVGRGLAAEDRRVSFRRHVVNHGHICTYNEGLEWASRDYCLALSADDLLLPESLARATSLLETHSEMSFCHGRAIRASSPSTAGTTHSQAVEVMSGQTFIRTICDAATNQVETPTVVVRTAIQHEAGGYDPALPHAGDLEMWLRLASYGSVGRIDAHQALYRVHGENMSIRQYGELADLTQRAAAFESFFARRGQAVADADQLRERALSQIALTAFWCASERYDQGSYADSHQFLESALQTWPNLKRTREWRRFAIRRRIGRFGTTVVRNVRDHFSTRTAQSSPVAPATR